MATEQETEQEHAAGGGDDDKAVGQGVFLVNNDRKGRVDAHGENLSGAEILMRVGLSAERYELFTEVHGHIGDAIPLDKIVPVKPGEHFRATLKGADYSAPSSVRS